MDEQEGDPFFKISVPEDDNPVEISEQFVYYVIDFSTQYGHDRSLSYTACNVVGKPTVFPKFGDSTQAFLMRTYGNWWTQLASTNFAKFNTVPPLEFPILSEDFLEVKFTDRVFPIEIDVFETYNPGALIKVFGYCYDTLKWEILWHSKPEYVASTNARIFTIKFSPVFFKTNCIRLEFNHLHLDYFYELDAIVLRGSSVLTHKEKKSISSPSFTLLSDLFYSITNTHEYSKEVPKPSDFEKLPNEICHLILSYLDLKSLCSTARVSKTFKKLCYDSVLYKVLNLQPYWSKVDNFTLEILQERCTSLQSLNLSWCGNRHRIDPKTFMLFAEATCQFLTSLKMSNCSFVNNLVLKTIAKTCQYLQVLELRSCHNADLNHIGFSQISLIKSLIYLDLYRTTIEKYSLILIIKSCSKLEYLFLGSCMNILQYNEIVLEIGKYLSNLKTLDLWRARSLTEAAVTILATECPNLVELDLGWCIQVNANSGCIRELVRNCTKLRKLFLTAIRTTSDNELMALATCGKEIELLDVLGNREITLSAVHVLLDSCKNLKLLDISFCKNITDSACTMLRLNFPNVQIKRLHHTFSED